MKCSFRQLKRKGHFVCRRCGYINTARLDEPPVVKCRKSASRTRNGNPEGAGTILSKYLARFGIRARANCKCKRWAKKMNRRGPRWCARNVDRIVGWMREEAERRGLPFNEFAAKQLVLMAIRKAKKNQRKAKRR